MSKKEPLTAGELSESLTELIGAQRKDWALEAARIWRS